MHTNAEGYHSIIIADIITDLKEKISQFFKGTLFTKMFSFTFSLFYGKVIKL